MNTIERIRAEVNKLPEKHKGLYKQFGNSLGFIDGLDMVKKILSDLEKEEKPTIQEQPVEVQKYRAYLISEIEKQYKQAERNYQEAYEQKNETRMFDEAERDAWKRVLDWLKEEHGYDSSNEDLVPEKEQPVCEELEEEIEMYFEDWDTNSNGAFFNEDGYKIDTIALKNIARHFYNLGCCRTAEKYDEIEYKRQRADVCEGLEEAAERYEHNRVYQDELDKYANYLDSLEEGETPRMEEPSPETKYLLNADMIESFKAGAKWQKEQMMKEAVEGMIDYVYDEKGDAYKAIRLDWIVGDFGDKVKVIVLPKEDGK